MTSAPHVAAPLPKPACGEVDVEDHSVPSAPDHVVLVRETVRQQLAALGACARPFRLHLNFTLEAAGLGQVRAKLSLLVYRTTGALAGEVPTTLTGDRSSASDVVATETLLRVGAESAARRYVRTFL